MSGQHTYSIRELEELSGIPAHTIRTWERRYGLFSPSRNAGNARCYDTADVAYLHQIVLLIRQGHRISVLAKKTREEIRQLINETVPASGDYDITEPLCMSLQEFDTQKAESLMSCHIRKEGFDRTLETRIIPFLDQLSFLILSGVLQTIHVQMFHELLRQKVYTALDALAPSRDGEHWILVHDKNSTQGIHRDIMRYFLKKANRHVVLAGEVDPARLEQITSRIQPNGYCLICSGGGQQHWLDSMLRCIPEPIRQQGKTLVLTPGKTLDFVNNTQIQEVKVLYGLQEALRYLQAG